MSVGRAFSTALCLAWCACEADPTPPSSAVSAPAPVVEGGVAGHGESPELEFGGCVRVRTGPVCEVLPGTPLTLWMATPFSQAEVWLGERRLPADDRVVTDGYQLVIVAEKGAGELRVLRPGRSTFRLQFSESIPNAALEEADRAKNAGEFERALELAGGVLERGSAEERLRARGIIARVRLRRGEVDRAVAELQETAEALFGVGQISDGARDVFAALYALIHRQHRLDAASRWLERWRAAIAKYPHGRALLADHDAMLAFAAGDAASALHHYQRVERAYERLSQAEDVRRVREEQIHILGELGEVQQAHALHLGLAPPGDATGACFKANFYSSRAWLTMLKVEHGGVELAGRVPEILAESARWEELCGDPDLVAMGLVNRGLWALDRRDGAAARENVRELSRRSPSRDPQLSAWIVELEGRAAFFDRRHALAIDHFERERAIGQASGNWDAQLRALVGIAEVERARGRSRAAELQLEAALRELERAQQYAPIGQLAHTHFASRQRAARRLVQSCLERGDVKRAYEVALTSYRAALVSQARSRQTRALAAADRERWLETLAEYQRRRAVLDAEGAESWRLSKTQLIIANSKREGELGELALLLDRATRLLPRADEWGELPVPEPGALWLLFSPIDAGWVVFSNWAGEIHAARFDTPSFEESSGVSPGLAGSALAAGAPEPPAATHRFLAPFERPLREAKSVVLLPAAGARDFQFERWSFDGHPLGRRSLAFGSGLPARGGPERMPERPLVIANPSGNLPFAEREGQLVQRALGAAPFDFLLAEQATLPAVLSRLESADHFHFAGHARSSSSQGGAALLMAHQTELAAWELFGLRSIPRHVVLSACHAGRADAESYGAGWSLAQVFLALGADAVLAPTRAMNDRDALAVQERFYKALGASNSFRAAFWATERERWDFTHGEAGTGLRLFVR